MEERVWYAVQTTREDDWGEGAWELEDAMQIADEIGANIIAVIITGGGDPVCIGEYTREEGGEWE